MGVSHEKVWPRGFSTVLQGSSHHFRVRRSWFLQLKHVCINDVWYADFMVWPHLEHDINLLQFILGSTWNTLSISRKLESILRTIIHWNLNLDDDSFCNPSQSQFQPQLQHNSSGSVCPWSDYQAKILKYRIRAKKWSHKDGPNPSLLR